MTSSGNSNSSTAPSFFENGTTEQFEYCYKIYPQVLRLKAEERGTKKTQDLIKLDDWYQNELPRLIKSRGKDKHMIYDELVMTMRWKQMRGKSYPQLSYLIKVNTPRAVMQETKKAFRKLPNLEQALTALSNLKGVGITMASALLAAAAPESAPFMADECLMAIPGIEGIDYTAREYLNFATLIQETVGRLNTESKKINSNNCNTAIAAAATTTATTATTDADNANTDNDDNSPSGSAGSKERWSPHRLELALWAYYVANELRPDLLEDMPGRNKCNSDSSNSTVVATNINGNSKADEKLLADSEDTNDLDLNEESLGLGTPAPTADIINAINTVGVGGIDSSTLKTSSLLQDGDSNFVSSDSTSQDQIIDENTTHTIATTASSSTLAGEIDVNDDAAVATPLASDSESNLEAAIHLQPNSNINNSKELNACSDVDAINALTSNGNGLLSTTGSSNSMDAELLLLSNEVGGTNCNSSNSNGNSNSNISSYNCDDNVKKICCTGNVTTSTTTVAAIGTAAAAADTAAVVAVATTANDMDNDDEDDVDDAVDENDEATKTTNCRKRSLVVDESDNSDAVSTVIIPDEGDATSMTSASASASASDAKRLRIE